MRAPQAASGLGHFKTGDGCTHAHEQNSLLDVALQVLIARH